MTKLCECHGLPMYRDKGKKPSWRCHVKRKASKRAYYHRDGWYVEYKRDLARRIRQRMEDSG